MTIGVPWPTYNFYINSVPLTRSKTSSPKRNLKQLIFGTVDDSKLVIFSQTDLIFKSLPQAGKCRLLIVPCALRHEMQGGSCGLAIISDTKKDQFPYAN